MSQLLLQLKQEWGHEMDVLKHNPVAFFVSHVEFGVSHDILTLTKSNGVQMLDWVHLFLDSERFDIFNRVGTCRQDEEDWRGWGRILEGKLKDTDGAEGSIAVDEVTTLGQVASDKVVERGSHTIWTHATNDKQLLEGLRLEGSPLERQCLVLWVQFVVPHLEPSWRVLGQVGSELLEAFDFDQFVDRIPGLIWEPLLEWVGHSSGDWAVDEEAHLL